MSDSILGTGEDALHKLRKGSILIDEYWKERLRKEGREEQMQFVYIFLKGPCDKWFQIF